MKENFLYTVEEFFRMNRKKLIGFVTKNIEDEPHRDAEDIVMDIMAKIFEMSDPAISVEKTVGYLYTALRNRIIDTLRTKKEPFVSYDDDDDFNFPDNLTYAMGNDSSNDLGERYDELYAAIDSLNPDEKALIIETDFEERSFRELSESWGVPVGTLLSRKKRALEKIRKIMVEGGKNHVQM